MTLRAVARTEFRRGLRSRSMWGLAVVAVLLLVGSVLTQSTTPRVSLRPAEASLYSAATLLSIAFPLAVLAASYGSIAGEVDSGKARCLLGLPVGRTTVFLGKLLGRTAVAWLAVAIAFLPATAALLLRFGRVPIGSVLALGGFTLLFAAVWTAIGVGLSSVFRRRGRALAGSLVTYFVLVVCWAFPFVSPRSLTARLVEDVLGQPPAPILYEFAYQTSPMTAYAYSVGRIVTGEGTAHLILKPWFLSLVLCCWLVGFVILGVLGFRNAEIA